jgi:putrescine---pyruvate transaminase
VQLDPAMLAADPALPNRVILALREHGVLSRALAVGALQISPPFVTSESDVSFLAEAIQAALEDVAPTVA